VSTVTPIPHWWRALTSWTCSWCWSRNVVNVS